MAVAGKQYVRCYEIIFTASVVTEDDFHSSDSDIHPNNEDNWEVCDTGNHTCAARGNTNSVLSDD